MRMNACSRECYQVLSRDRLRLVGLYYPFFCIAVVAEDCPSLGVDRKLCDRSWLILFNRMFPKRIDVVCCRAASKSGSLEPSGWRTRQPVCIRIVTGSNTYLYAV
jgi:hypothetical protein